MSSWSNTQLCSDRSTLSPLGTSTYWNNSWSNSQLCTDWSTLSPLGTSTYWISSWSNSKLCSDWSTLSSWHLQLLNLFQCRVHFQLTLRWTFHMTNNTDFVGSCCKMYIKMYEYLYCMVYKIHTFNEIVWARIEVDIKKCFRENVTSNMRCYLIFEKIRTFSPTLSWTVYQERVSCPYNLGGKKNTQLRQLPGNQHKRTFSFSVNIQHKPADEIPPETLFTVRVRY